jgi:adenylate cyclase
MPFILVSADRALHFELHNDSPWIVGRASECDVSVVDATVSRQHAELTVGVDGVEVRDLNSRNGTFVNGVRVDRARATPGDSIVFGHVEFDLVEGLDVSSYTPLTGVAAITPMHLPGGANTTQTAPAARPRPGERPQQSRPRPSLQPVVRAMPTPVHERILSPAFVPVQRLRQTAGAERDTLALEALLRVTIGLTRAESIEALLGRIADSAFEMLDIDYVSLLIANEHGEFVPRASRDRDERAPGRATPAPPRGVPQTILQRVVEDRVAILSHDASEDGRFDGDSIVAQNIRSALCVPLIADNNVLGVLYADNRRAAHRFDEKDLDILIAFAGVAAVSIENARFADRIRRETLKRRNFERFFAPALAARIASSPDAARLGGERQRVAVLFCDIRDFTRLSATMSPVDIASLLSEFFAEMVECVFHAGGTLDKFIGDGLMAQWGAPISDGDDANHALEAALDMMRAVNTLNARWRAAGRPELAIGIGIDVGDAFAGNIGSNRRMEYTVIGDPATIASKLCASAPGGAILISDDFRRAVTCSPQLEPSAPLALKGRAEPVPVYRIGRGEG